MGKLELRFRKWVLWQRNVFFQPLLPPPLMLNNVLVPSLSNSSNSWTRVEGEELYIQYEEQTSHYMFGCPRWQPLQILNLVNPLHSSWKGSITQHMCPIAFGVLDFPCTMVVDPCHFIRNGIHHNITRMQTLEFPH